MFGFQGDSQSITWQSTESSVNFDRFDIIFCATKMDFTVFTDAQFLC